MCNCGGDDKLKLKNNHQWWKNKQLLDKEKEKEKDDAEASLIKQYEALSLGKDGKNEQNLKNEKDEKEAEVKPTFIETIQTFFQQLFTSKKEVPTLSTSTSTLTIQPLKSKDEIKSEILTSSSLDSSSSLFSSSSISSTSPSSSPMLIAVPLSSTILNNADTSSSTGVILIIVFIVVLFLVLLFWIFVIRNSNSKKVLEVKTDLTKEKDVILLKEK